jgi:hypothetical protein
MTLLATRDLPDHPGGAGTETSEGTCPIPEGPETACPRGTSAPRSVHLPLVD